MARYEDRHLAPVLVEMRDVERGGLVMQEPVPDWPGDAAPEADQLAWNAGYSAIDLGAPISVTVRTYDDGRVTYGFSFHYQHDGQERVTSTPPGLTRTQANFWLDGVRRAAHFLKYRPD